MQLAMHFRRQIVPASFFKVVEPLGLLVDEEKADIDSIYYYQAGDGHMLR